MSNGLKLRTVAVILAVSVVIGAGIVSNFFVRIRHEQAIAVKGYAEQDVASDIGRFVCSVTARGASLQEAYGKLEASRARVLARLTEAGFAEDETAEGTIETAKLSRRDAQGRETNEVEFYDLSQSVAVASTNVTRILGAAAQITELIREGIDVSACDPEFTISSLQEVKLQLLARATEDGYRRAVALAESSKGKVGALISAEQGVFQITRRNSTDTSGYGMYDTSTIEKTAKAVVTLQYAIEAGK